MRTELQKFHYEFSIYRRYERGLHKSSDFSVEYTCTLGDLRAAYRLKPRRVFCYSQASTHPKYDSSLAAAMAEVGGRIGLYGTAATAGMYNNGYADSGGTVVCEACARRRLQRYPPNVHKALDSIQFIANHMASSDDSRRVN